MKLRVWLLISSLATASCGGILEKALSAKPTDAEMAEQVSRLSQTEVRDRSAQPVGPGSLWPADDHVFFFSDRKALRVGDIITVRIVENARANNTADTDLSRNSSIDAGLSHFFGRDKFLKMFKLGDDLIQSTADSVHQGSGSTTRQGQLTATITAVVKDVLPNGNLVIQGTRALTVNHEEQYITITGIVRPADVNRDNVVLSTQVADANIAIGGTGVVTDKQRPGWGTRVFDWIWPF